MLIEFMGQTVLVARSTAGVGFGSSEWTSATTGEAPCIDGGGGDSIA